ncbi:hypothetical protein [Streptodolium elevatio]
MSATVAPLFAALVYVSLESDPLDSSASLPLTIAGSLLVLLGTWPLWLLFGARYLGVRPRGVVVGSGRFRSARLVVGGTPRLRRAKPTGWGVVAVPDAGTSRWRMWSAFAVPVLLQVCRA